MAMGLVLLMLEVRVCISGARQSSDAIDGRKHCLLMDEVDGMAGNEDRGGVQVLPSSYALLFSNSWHLQSSKNWRILLVQSFTARICHKILQFLHNWRCQLTQVDLYSGR